MTGKMSIFRTIGVSVACFLAVGSAAHAQNSEYLHNQNNGKWSYGSYVDFATSTIAGHANNPTRSFGGATGLKYKFLQLDDGDLLSNKKCFEVITRHPDFLPAVTADTRIWIVSGLGSPNPVSLSDDWAGSPFSAARVWLQGGPTSYINLAVAAYSTAWNTMQFALVVNLLPLNMADCTTNQPAPALPWVKVINGTMTKSAKALAGAAVKGINGTKTKAP